MALTISLLVILVLSTTLLAMAGNHEFKETEMTVYLHDFTGAGPNLTSLPVAGIAGKLWVFNQFGTVYVNDDIMTGGPTLKSAVIGRGQSIAVTASLDGRNALVFVSLAHTKYNGSTIEIHGDYKQFDPSTELGVVSGTGKFRFARGYAIFETVFYDQPSGYSVLRCNITMLHY